MGKGTIISHYGDGKYSVELNLDRSRVTDTIALLESRISDLATRIAALDDGDEKTALQLEKTSLEKRKATIQASIETDPVVDAWCADYTTDLSGEVGTLEIPGERGSVQIHPGYDGAGAYNSTRDGQLQPAAAGTPASVFYNLAMLPGWQRYKPTFRVGTIVADSIDFNADTCDVCLDSETSSQLNLVINQDAGFGGCETATHSGFTDFCTDNPAHPLCTNTDDPDAPYISDSQFDELVTVNSEVNSSHPYLSDVAGWQTGDSWDLLGEGEAGDCEDLQLTKADSLINDYGWDAKHLRMAVCETELGTGHAVLIVETANRGTLVLDNRYDYPMRIERLPYRFLSRQKAGTTWESFSTRLESVSIEYMSCNSAAFADGDRVVVEFEGQDWSSPKVVGFESEPAQCGYLWITAVPKRYSNGFIQSDYRRHIVVDGTTGELAQIQNAAGTGNISFPCTTADLQHWIDETETAPTASTLVSQEVADTSLYWGGWDSAHTRTSPRAFAHNCYIDSVYGAWCEPQGNTRDSCEEEDSYSNPISGETDWYYHYEYWPTENSNAFAERDSEGGGYRSAYKSGNQTSWRMTFAGETALELYQYETYGYLHAAATRTSPYPLEYSCAYSGSSERTERITSPRSEGDLIEQTLTCEGYSCNIPGTQDHIEWMPCRAGVQATGGLSFFCHGLVKEALTHNGSQYVSAGFSTTVYASLNTIGAGENPFQQARNSTLEARIAELLDAAFNEESGGYSWESWRFEYWVDMSAQFRQ